MIQNILKGFVLGLLLFVFAGYLWYLIQRDYSRTLYVKTCDHAGGQGLKALSKLVRGSWLHLGRREIQVFSDGSCMFFQFDENRGTLFYGLEVTSGYVGAVTITSKELHRLADSIPANTGFEKTVDYLSVYPKVGPSSEF